MNLRRLQTVIAVSVLVGGVGGLVSGCSGSAESTGATAAQAITSCGQETVKGIDVYEGDNNGNTIDWSAVHAGGTSFAFAKATEGVTYTDSKFSTNWPAMKGAGLVRGAYHFFHPEDDATTQAKFFVQTVGAVSQGDLLVLDFESNGGLSDAELSSAALTFLSVVESATGLKPMLYASSDFLSDWGQLGQYPLWVANYGVSCPNVPSAWSAFTFWQNSGSGSATGIDAAVDTDFFNGSLAELLAFNGAPATAGCTVTTTGATGTCVDTSVCASQGGTSTPGFCPGEENIQCCTEESSSGGSDTPPSGAPDAGAPAIPAGDCALGGQSFATDTCTETLQCSGGSWVDRRDDGDACSSGALPDGACITDDGSVAPENTCTSTLQCDDGVWVDRHDDVTACL